MPGEGGKRLSALLSSRNCRAICRRKDSGWCHKGNRMLVTWARDTSSCSWGEWKGLCQWGNPERGLQGYPELGAHCYVPDGGMSANSREASPSLKGSQCPSEVTLRCLDPLLQVPLGKAPAWFLLALFRKKLGRGRTMGCCIAPPTVLGPWVILFFSLYCFVSLKKKKPSFLS